MKYFAFVYFFFISVILSEDIDEEKTKEKLLELDRYLY